MDSGVSCGELLAMLDERLLLDEDGRMTVWLYLDGDFDVDDLISVGLQDCGLPFRRGVFDVAGRRLSLIL